MPTQTRAHWPAAHDAARRWAGPHWFTLREAIAANAPTAAALVGAFTPTAPLAARLDPLTRAGEAAMAAPLRAAWPSALVL